MYNSMMCVCVCLRLKESGAINTSLFMLSEVVDALNKQKVSSYWWLFGIYFL